MVPLRECSIVAGPQWLPSGSRTQTLGVLHMGVWFCDIWLSLHLRVVIGLANRLENKVRILLVQTMVVIEMHRDLQSMSILYKFICKMQ